MEVKYNLPKRDGGQGGGGKVVETTYADLVALRDAGELVPGAAYRITDYECTTSQENTSSAGIGFDIIVKAITSGTLDENAKAARRTGTSITQVGVEVLENEIFDNPIRLANKGSKLLLERAPSKDTEAFYAFNSGVLYTITDNLYIDLTLMCTHEIPEDGDVVYAFNPMTGEAESIEGVLSFYTRDFFEDIDKWELKYCLDNDTERFAWANDENGKGVVFHMKDEWGNESYYDFINIRFAFDALNNEYLSTLGERGTFAPGCINNKVTENRITYTLYDDDGTKVEKRGLLLEFVALGQHCKGNTIENSTNLYIGAWSENNDIYNSTDSFSDCYQFFGNRFNATNFEIHGEPEGVPSSYGVKLYPMTMSNCEAVGSILQIHSSYRISRTKFFVTRLSFSQPLGYGVRLISYCIFKLDSTASENTVTDETLDEEELTGILITQPDWSKAVDLHDLITEAPLDDKQYARCNGEWEEVTNPSDILIDAPEIMLAGGTLSWATMSTCGLSHEQYNALPDGAIVTVKLRADASSNVENFPMAITKIDAQGNGKAAASALCLGQNSSYVMVLFRMTITASGVECEYTTKTIN